MSLLDAADRAGADEVPRAFDPFSVLRDPARVSVNMGVAALLGTVGALLGPDALAGVVALLARPAWRALRTDRARGLFYLAMLVGDMEGAWGPATPESIEKLQALRQHLLAASRTARPMSQADEAVDRELDGAEAELARREAAPICTRHPDPYDAAMAEGADIPPPRALCEACRAGGQPAALHTCRVAS